MPTKTKIKKEHGYIAAALGALAVTAHVTHLPLLLLAFFGFVSAGLAESVLFKVLAIGVSIASIALFIWYKKRCSKQKCCNDQINNK